MTPTLEVLKDEALSQTSRNPTDVEPYQRLIWLAEINPTLDARSQGMCFGLLSHATFSSCTLPEIPPPASVRAVLREAVYKWHRALWTNLSNSWMLATHDSRRESLFNGSILNVLHEDTSLPKASSQFFSVRRIMSKVWSRWPSSTYRVQHSCGPPLVHISTFASCE